ncbi:hypothetical protein AKJ16_DCAP10796 [Drosera capensis]
MAMQTGGAASSKVLILVGAGLTGSVILKSGALSDVILQVQELIKGVNEADIYLSKSDAAVIAAQGAMLLTWFLLLPLEPWDIATCGGRTGHYPILCL